MKGAAMAIVALAFSAGPSSAETADHPLPIEIYPRTPIDTNDTTPTLTFELDDYPDATFECSLSDQPFAPCLGDHSHTVPVPLSDGGYGFRVRALEGPNVVGEGSAFINVDTVAPQIEVTGPNFINPGSIGREFEVIAHEIGLAELSCDVDSERPRRPCFQPNYGGLQSDGLHRYVAAATDQAGNTTVASKLYAMSTDPETSYTMTPGTLTNDSTPRFEFTSDGDNDEFRCRFDDGAFKPCSTDTSDEADSPLADGVHTFSLRAFRFGLEEDHPIADQTFRVDTQPPDTRIVSAPPSLSNLKAASFRFASDESGSAFSCSLDGASPSACESPWTESLGPGTHTFSVWAQDPAGNRDGTPASVSFEVDRTRPELSFVHAPPHFTRSRSAAFEVSSPEHVDLECRLDNRYLPCRRRVRFMHLARGHHVFLVRARDAAGNWTPPHRWKWRVGRSLHG